MNTVDTSHTLFQKTLLTLHALTFFSLIFSPFYLSWRSQIYYGYIISYMFSATIMGWIYFGRCIVSDLENSHKYGSIPTFFHVVVGINMKHYHTYVANFVTYSSFLIKMYYAPTIGFMIFSLILIGYYKLMKFLISKRKNKYEF